MTTLATGHSIKPGIHNRYRTFPSNNSLNIDVGTSYSKPISSIPSVAHHSLIPATSNPDFMRRGFTLIEIMVVLLIIGVILGVAIPAMNFNSIEDRLKEETSRLVALLDLASQESILNSRTIGINTGSDHYQFLIHEDNKWKLLDDKLLTKRNLPEDMELELLIEDDHTSTSTGNPKNIPQITFLDSGEIDPPFIINIKSHSTETYFSVNGYENGKIETKKHSRNQ